MDWLIEPEVFAPGYAERMAAAVAAAGHRLRRWDDAWWDEGLPRLDGPVVFHGSLGNAAELARRGVHQPGAFCDVAAFHCSAWYPRTEAWRLQRPYLVLPARALVADPDAVRARLGSERLFVRPDSPLKPFAGRVLDAGAITLAELDHGLYWDDVELPVVAAPVRRVGREWRFVVVDRRVVAGSAYLAEGRSARSTTIEAEVVDHARALAAALEPPERVYVLDLCESDDGLRLLELNPFSGADLYACDLDSIVRAVSGVVVEGGEAR